MGSTFMLAVVPKMESLIPVSLHTYFMVVKVVLPRRVWQIVFEHLRHPLRLKGKLEEVHHGTVAHRKELLAPRLERRQPAHRVARHRSDKLQTKQ
jgi:hypothetical protein